MKCVRCQGLMVKEEVFTENGEASMLHCLNCGEWIDLTIVSNRSFSRIAFPKLHNRTNRRAAASLWLRFMQSKTEVIL